MRSLEVYFFICYGISGAPADQLGVYLSHDLNDQPRKMDTWKLQSHWALSVDMELPNMPTPIPVLIHVYYEGDLPDDETRDKQNVHIVRMTRQTLLAEPKK